MNWAGVGALDLAMLGVGFAILHGLRLVPTWRRAFELVGAAFMAGWALTGVVASLLLLAGASLAVWQALLALALASGALLTARRRAPVSPAAARSAVSRRSLAVAAGSGLLLAVYLGVHLRRALNSGVGWWDAWAFWVPKAKSIYYFNGLDLGPGGFASFANPEYPIGVPALDALVFRFAGAPDPLLLLGQDWVVGCAFLAAVAGLLAPRVPPHLLWPGLLLLAVVPNFGRELGAQTGDLAVAVAFALGGVSATLWLVERRPAHLALAALFLAAASVSKNDGLFMVLLLAVLVALVQRPPRRTLVAAALAVPALVLAGIWYVWLRVEDVPYVAAYSLRDAIDVGFLLDRAGRLAIVLQELPWYFLDPGLWHVALPAGLAAAALAIRRRRDVATLVLALVPLSFAGLAVVYWISALEVHWHLGTSAYRVPGPVVLFVASLLPLLLAEALEEEES